MVGKAGEVVGKVEEPAVDAKAVEVDKVEEPGVDAKVVEGRIADIGPDLRIGPSLAPRDRSRSKSLSKSADRKDKKAGGVLQKLRNSCHKGYSWNQKGRKSCKS